MMDDLEQMIKERLLEDLIDKMSDAGGESRLKPHGLGVSVEAPDKAALAEGLDKAKGLVAKGGPPEIPEAEGKGEPEGDDESRLLELLGDDDDDEELKGR